MDKASKVDLILEEVEKRERITEEERIRVRDVAGKLKRRVEENLQKLGAEAEVSIEGSVAKDTWLKSDTDIDIFMLIPESVERQKLASTYLEVAKESVKDFPWTERYAEHPYIEARVRLGKPLAIEARVNIVPCYKVKPTEWKSATDRTPYHTRYVREHLKTESLRREVRFLKRFMKAIKVYGSDIKVGGFSGYMAELLVIRYGSFLKVLEAASNWRDVEVVDVEGHYGEAVDEARRLFNEPLIFVDPVDKYRNVSSPVTATCFNLFRAASKFFLKNPSTAFFYPPETVGLTVKELRRRLKSSQTDLLLLELGTIDAVPDVLWGQLYKTEKALRNLLQQYDFEVLRSSAWSDERNLNVLLFELDSCLLRDTMKHQGPPVLSGEEETFVSKYIQSERTISGPSIENGRWVVYVNRKYRDARVLLKEKLADTGRSVGVASRVSEAVKRGFRVLLNEEITDVYAKKPQFAVFLTEFLKGKPIWLE